MGIAAYIDGDRVTINSCGSLHDPGAISSLLEPVETIDISPATPDSGDGGFGMLWPALGLAGGAVLAVSTVVVERRRPDDWHDGWSSSG